MIIAVDTGATKTLVATLHQDGQIAKSIKFPTPKQQPEYFEQLIATIREVADGRPFSTISIALPGTVMNGVVKWCFNLKWGNVDVHTPLEEAFPGVRVLLENDANLAGLGETRMLETTPRSSLYVTFSTGIGTGIIINGHIDPNFSISEGGRAVVEYKGELHNWEEIAAGRTVYNVFGKYARDIDDEDTWRDIADRMSRGLLAQLPFMQPDVIIFGGSMGTYFHRYEGYLQAILDEHLEPELVQPKLLAAQNPEEAVIYGCYYAALDADAA